MTKMMCINMLADGTICTRPARNSGYCKECDPKSTVEEQRKIARENLERAKKQEQKKELFDQELTDMVAECHSVEDVRKVQLKVIEGLIRGTVDARAGASIAAMLKHQEHLLDRKDEDNKDLKPNERDRAIALAKEMTPETMLGFIGDMAHGIKNLIKKAKEQEAVITISAQEEEHA